MERRKNVNATHGRKCAFKTVGLTLVGKSASVLKVESTLSRQTRGYASKYVSEKNF